MFPVVGHFDRPLQSAPTMFQPFLRPCSILWRFYVGAENSKIPIPKIRYHPFGIGIGTDIAFGISVPESTAGSTEIPKYRISFGIPSSGNECHIWIQVSSTNNVVQKFSFYYIPIPWYRLPKLSVFRRVTTGARRFSPMVTSLDVTARLPRMQFRWGLVGSRWQDYFSRW